MPKLIPPYLIKTSPFCETKIHNIFKNTEMLSDYTIFHSLNIAHHKYKREGEADFVIIGPKGVLVLEIKGADKIIRKEGKWIYYTRNKKYISNESPFNQAKYNLYSLLNNINNSCGINIKYNSGYGVVFTNLIFNERSPEWDNIIVYDESSGVSFEEYIENLYDFWNNKITGRGNRALLSNNTISLLIQYLRGNFEIVESVVSFSDKINKLIEKLTKEQSKYLDVVAENPRLLVKGYAGTGKTMLAIEQAKRASNQYNNILFICYNRLLSYHIKAQLNKQVSNVDILTFDSLLYSIYKKYYGNVNKLNIETLRNIVYMIKNKPGIKVDKYDYLIIDEAQDIFGIELTEFINQFLEGGIESGRWSIFYDDEVQSKLYKYNNSKLSYEYIGRYSVIVSLNVNCRNPKHMMKEVNRITKLPISNELKIDMHDNCIDYLFYKNNREQPTIIANKILKYVKQGYSPNQITLLFMKNDTSLVDDIYILINHKIRSIVDLREYYLQYDNNINIYLDKGDIGFSTIQSYKGLENDVIIICDVDGLMSEYDKSVFYVGVSRAKLQSTLVCNDKLKSLILN